MGKPNFYKLRLFLIETSHLHLSLGNHFYLCYIFGVAQLENILEHFTSTFLIPQIAIYNSLECDICECHLFQGSRYVGDKMDKYLSFKLLSLFDNLLIVLYFKLLIHLEPNFILY